MKDELGGNIMRTFVGLRAKTYSYLIDDGSEDKKSTKKCVTYNLKIIKPLLKQLNLKIK